MMKNEFENQDKKYHKRRGRLLFGVWEEDEEESFELDEEMGR